VTVRGTLIGLDFGERRIGVAVGETAIGIANPLGHIAASANEQRLEEIAKIVAEWRPAAFVLGVPRHGDGSEHAVARLAQKFGRRLGARFGLPVFYVDETLTSATAESELRQARTRSRRPGDVDALAAAYILQSWLDSPHAHGETAA
jgi:putative Holliday junction resolvase